MDAGKGLANNRWTLASKNEYKERITYDSNGNILKYLRNGNSTSKILMDSLNYKYYAGTNRLSHVRDSVPDAVYGLPGYEDIDNQTANNYTYDSIGNLIKDVSENISAITWNVYGKITQVAYSNTANNTLKNLYYYYDAAGNRMGKRVEKYNSSGTINSTYTWYVRDATGNVMAVYSSTANGSSIPANLALKEEHVYGSSRVGILSLSKDVKNPVPSYPLTIPYRITLSRGNKSYELTNHLGNVLVTISDKKLGHSANGTTIDYYDADQVSANDYYPFGSTMPSRSTGSYRYGFNGKEKDKDGDGGSLQIDYGNRIYDPHLGRFKSVDPLQKKYSDLTPYNFVANNPIIFIDPDGKRIILAGTQKNKDEFVAKLSLLTGFKLQLEKDGNIKIIGDNSNPKSTNLKNAVFELLDEKGKKYDNDVMFKLVDNKNGFKNKRFGNIDGTKIYFDSYNTGAFDMEDFKKIKGDEAYAAFLAHVIGERAYVPNYKKLIEEKEKVKDYDKKTKTLTIEGSDPVFDNAHVAGQILETKVLSEFFTDDNGRPINLTPPGNLTTYSTIEKSGKATFSYGGVDIQATSSTTNTDDVQTVETKIKNSSLIKKN